MLKQKIYINIILLILSIVYIKYLHNQYTKTIINLNVTNYYTSHLNKKFLKIHYRLNTLEKEQNKKNIYKNSNNEYIINIIRNFKNANFFDISKLNYQLINTISNLEPSLANQNYKEFILEFHCPSHTQAMLFINDLTKEIPNFTKIKKLEITKVAKNFKFKVLLQNIHIKKKQPKIMLLE